MMEVIRNKELGLNKSSDVFIFVYLFNKCEQLKQKKLILQEIKSGLKVTECICPARLVPAAVSSGREVSQPPQWRGRRAALVKQPASGLLISGDETPSDYSHHAADSVGGVGEGGGVRHETLPVGNASVVTALQKSSAAPKYILTGGLLGQTKE